MKLPREFKDNIIDIPGKPGYVRIRFHDDMVTLLAESTLWGIKADRYSDEDAITRNGFLMSNVFKRNGSEGTKLVNKERGIELSAALAMAVDVDDVTVSEMITTVTCASVEHEITCYWRGRHYLKWNWDTASVIRMPWWPRLLQEWKTRKRSWPDRETIEAVSQDVYVLGKPSDSENENSTEFRYSFSHIEPLLVEKRSEQQKFIYLIFKAMFYQHLKPLDYERMQSYFAKTVMLWFCEQHPPNDQIWARDDITTFLTLKYIFGKMLGYFIEGFMPYYFIPSINVIAKVDNCLKEIIISKIQTILNVGLESYLPKSVDQITEISEKNVQDFQNLHDLLKMVQKRQYFLLFYKYRRYWKELSTLFCKVGLHQ